MENKLKSTPNLIGISGKMGCGWGKDTVGSILKLLNVDEREFTPTTANITADLKLDSYYALFDSALPILS